MFVERDGQTISGRWFSGRPTTRTGSTSPCTRIASGPLVLGLDPARPARRHHRRRVRVFGVNLDRASAAPQLDLGPGVRVTQRRRAPRAASPPRSRSRPTRPWESAICSWPALPRREPPSSSRRWTPSRSRPSAGLARVGGIRFAKRPEQFEARAWSHGPDGKPDTKDDLDLGAVAVAWSLEEFTATFGDDDKQWAGTIDAQRALHSRRGRPQPEAAGQPEQRGRPVGGGDPPRRPAPGSPRRPLRARAHLIVTVPLYVRWDQPEVMP